MIKIISIRNFQSHRKTKLKLSEGINLIMGETDAGKSSIIRALNWIINNKPSGESFRSHWKGKTSVTITINKNIIKRVRSGKINRYVLDGGKLEACKGKVPLEISQAINIHDVAFQKQITPPFLFTSSGGEVARYLNKMVRLDLIDRCFKRIKKIIHNENQTLIYKSQDLSSSKAEKKEYNWIHQAEGELVGLETLDVQLKRDRREIVGLSDLLSQMSEIEKGKERYLFVDECLIGANELVKRIKDTKERDKKLSTLEMTLDEIEDNEKEILEIDNMLKTKKKKLKIFLEKQCPLCGRSEK